MHATRRAAGDDEAAIRALDALPGAKQRLRWFDADLKQAGSFDAAVAGCKWVPSPAAYVLAARCGCLQRLHGPDARVAAADRGLGAGLEAGGAVNGG